MASYVYDREQLVYGCNVDKVTILHKSRVLKAPMEDGRVSIDDKVIDPNEVVVVGRVPYYDESTITTLQCMQWDRRPSFHKVMSDGIIIDKLILVNLKYERSKESPDWYDVELTFQEAMMIQTKRVKPKNSDRTSTGSNYAN